MLQRCLQDEKRAHWKEYEIEIHGRVDEQAETGTKAPA